MLVIHYPGYDDVHFIRAYSATVGARDLFTVKIFPHAYFSQEESTSKMVSFPFTRLAVNLE